MFLEKIDDTNDLKKLNRKELKELANEVRAALINKISKAGGHSGPNLGMVEMTVALHYVFDSPNDKFVFDVSHQSYPHKILTGRKEAFLDEEHIPTHLKVNMTCLQLVTLLHLYHLLLG